jgi:hypothetical protein
LQTQTDSGCGICIRKINLFSKSIQKKLFIKLPRGIFQLIETKMENAGFPALRAISCRFMLRCGNLNVPAP